MRKRQKCGKTGHTSSFQDKADRNKLAMFFSGDKAAFHSAAMVSILSRYYAGDESVTEDIEANAVSWSVCVVLHLIYYINMIHAKANEREPAVVSPT
jgi:hypothetical protein